MVVTGWGSWRTHFGVAWGKLLRRVVVGKVRVTSAATLLTLRRIMHVARIMMSFVETMKLGLRAEQSARRWSALDR